MKQAMTSAARGLLFSPLAALAGAALLLAGCATTSGPEMKRLVWPPPPQEARIEFVRSLFSEEDLGRDVTFNEKVIEFVAGKKPPANRISEPMALAVSDDGERVYVSDYAQLAVFVFDFGRKAFTKIGKDEALARPFGIALDGEENLYVVEQEKKGVHVFDRKGKTLRFITDPSIDRPSGVAIDRARGRLYVVDTGHTRSREHTVKIFDLEGKLVGSIGHGKGTDEGQFLFPTYVTVDAKGNVYVTDTLNSRVQEFDANGKLVAKFGDRGTGWGMFDKPKGAALDGFGNLYVVDSAWGNVQIFNPKGQVLLFFGGRGQYPGMLLNPSAIAIDAKNRIYVADYLNHRVEVYRLIHTKAEDSFEAPKAAASGAVQKAASQGTAR
ncbi:MAG: SMP-30/gluconolactonase/LRE family protein [Betaproteobacteria bacterium]